MGSRLGLFLNGPPSLVISKRRKNLLGDPFLVFFDDDVIVGASCLAAYQRAHNQFPGRKFFGGPTSGIFEKSCPKWLESLQPSSVNGLRYSPEELKTRKKEPFFLGFNWACSRSLILEYGGFDLRFGPGSLTGATGQETRMQNLLKQSGVRAVYVPDAGVAHFVPAESISLRWAIRRRYRNGMEFELNYPSGIRARFIALIKKLILLPLGFRGLRPGGEWLCGLGFEMGRWKIKSNRFFRRASHIALQSTSPAPMWSKPWRRRQL